MKKKKRGSARLGNFIVLAAAVIISLAISLGLYFDAGLGLAPTFLAGTAILFVLTMVHGMVRRTTAALVLEPRIWHLEASLDKLSRNIEEVSEFSARFENFEALADDVEAIQIQLHDIGQSEIRSITDQEIKGLQNHIAYLEKQIETFKVEFKKQNSEQKARLESELRLIQTLVKQLAEQMASSNQSAGHSHKAMEVAEIVQQDDKKSPTASEAPKNRESDQQLHKDSTALFHSLDRRRLDEEMLEVVRQSIEDKRIELFLQPIVTLPQRKVRYYEALTRIKDRAGQIILPQRYIHLAENAGIMPLIDNVMLFRSVQVIRRLTTSTSPRGVFCNISMHSLLDSEFFSEFTTFMEQNQELSEYLYFEFSQHMIKNAGALELKNLAVLSELGFRFSIDRVDDLDIDFRALGDRGFRFIKIDSMMFLDGMEQAGASIHPADMRSYLNRFGIELIVEKIEDERSLARLLKRNIELGQGFLFSEARPVRPEIFAMKHKTDAA